MLALFSRGGEPNQRTRRLIVIAALLAMPGVIGTLEFVTARDWPFPIGLLLFALPLVVASVPLLALQEFRRNVFRRPSPDERERERRNEAYRISYRIIELLVPAAFLLGAIWGWSGDGRIWGTLFILGFGYVIFLPYAVFAWREPDAVD